MNKTRNQAFMSFILDLKQNLLVTYPICSYNYFHLEGKQ